MKLLIPNSAFIPIFVLPLCVLLTTLHHLLQHILLWILQLTVSHPLTLYRSHLHVLLHKWDEHSLLRCCSYNPGTHLQPDMFSAQHWSPTRKKAFEKRIMRLTASARFPLSWTENLEWRLF